MSALLSAGELDPDAPWCPGCGFANYSAGPCEVCGYDDDGFNYRAAADFIRATADLVES